MSGSPTWPFVLAFARRMEAKLQANRHKGDRAGWLKEDSIALHVRLREEVVELYEAMQSGGAYNPEEIIDEAADVANFAMMIADRMCLIEDAGTLQDFDVYQAEAARTLARKPLAEYSEEGLKLKLATMGLGLAGESGEAADLIKKHVGHGHDLDDAKLLKELGDVLWYIAAIATLRGFSLEEVASTNITKLRARYPAGFSEEASKNRKPEEG